METVLWSPRPSEKRAVGGEQAKRVAEWVGKAREAGEPLGFVDATQRGPRPSQPLEAQMGFSARLFSSAKTYFPLK